MVLRRVEKSLPYFSDLLPTNRNFSVHSYHVAVKPWDICCYFLHQYSPTKTNPSHVGAAHSWSNEETNRKAQRFPIHGALADWLVGCLVGWKNRFVCLCALLHRLLLAACYDSLLLLCAF